MAGERGCSEQVIDVVRHGWRRRLASTWVAELPGAEGGQAASIALGATIVVDEMTTNPREQYVSISDNPHSAMAPGSLRSGSSGPRAAS